MPNMNHSVKKADINSQYFSSISQLMLQAMWG